MISTITRRQMLAAGASTLLALKTANAATLLGNTPNEKTSKYARQMASWADGSLNCWFQGLAEDIPLVVTDAQEVMGDKAVFHNLDFSDFPLIFADANDRSRIPALVGCSTTRDARSAVEEAFGRALGPIAIADLNLIHSCLIITTSASSQPWRVSDHREFCVWARDRLTGDSCYQVHMLKDDSRGGGSKRVSVVISHGLPPPQRHIEAQLSVAVPRHLDGEVPCFLQIKPL